MGRITVNPESAHYIQAIPLPVWYSLNHYINYLRGPCGFSGAGNLSFQNDTVMI